jgi:hypothetical protein
MEKGRKLRIALRLLGLFAVALGIVVALQLSQHQPAEAQNIRAMLVAGHSGKCLAVYPGAFNNGAVTYQWTCGGNNNVEILDAGAGFHYIRFLHSGKCLTVNGFAWWDGATLDQWDCLGQANQKWTGTFAANVFQLHASQANPTKCITVHGESQLNGAIVNQWQCVSRANQAWNTISVGPPPATATPTPVPDDEGTLTIIKICEPQDDPGRFRISVNTTFVGTLQCNQQLGPFSIDEGTYVISETGATGTSINDYETFFSVDCSATSAAHSAQVVVEEDENSTCVIRNVNEAPEEET